MKASSSQSPPYIRSVYIDKIKHFQKFFIEFDPHLNLIVGPNGVGKTTLLDLICSLFSKDYINPEREYGNENYILSIQIGNLIWNKELLTKLDIESKERFEIYTINNSQMRDVPTELISNKKSEYKKAEIKYNQKIELIILKHKFGKSHKEALFIKSGDTYIKSSHSLYSLRDWFPNIFQNHRLDKSLEDLIEYAESTKELSNHFDKVVDTSSKKIDAIVGDQKQNFSYSGKVRINVEVKNYQGRNIRELSSGENQIQMLELAKKRKASLLSQICLIDEPELHLNPGNNPLLLELIKNLKNSSQLIIATHSVYLVRVTDPKFFKFIKFDNRKSPYLVKIPLEHHKVINILPELLFSDAVVLFEERSTSILFEKIISLLFKDLGFQNTFEQNVSFLSVEGKSQLAKVVTLANNLDLPNVTIVDNDFIKNTKDYSFIGRDDTLEIKNKIESLTTTRVSSNKFATSLKENGSAMLQFLDDIFNKDNISENDRISYNKLRDNFKIIEYKKLKWYDLLSVINKKIVHSIFQKNNIWMLRLGEIEDYIVPKLKDRKLSVSLINEYFNPENCSEVAVYFKSKKHYQELISIAKFINKKISGF